MNTRRARRWTSLLTLSLVAGLGGLGAQCPPSTWRSTLYPSNWTPGYADSQGRFLHDFSYAGYRNGASEPPTNPPGATFDVVAGYGADPTGTTDSTAAIQQAIDAAEAAAGGIVLVPAGTYRCDGVLEVAASNVVIRGAGESATKIYFTRFAGMGDHGHVWIHGAVSRGADHALVVDGVNGAMDVQVADVSGLSVGDDVSLGWVITPEFVAEHNMTGTWQAFNGQWESFFKRKIVAITPVSGAWKLTFDVPLRYPAKLRDSASVRRETGWVSEVGIESLSLSNAVAWPDAWTEVRNHVLLLEDVKDAWVRHVASFASPYPPAAGYHLQNGGLDVLESKRVTVTDTTLEKAQNRGDGGSGYLFEISMSNEVLTRDSVARDGRHNFIQNWGFGTTGCVWLRVSSTGSKCGLSPDLNIYTPCYSEFHHSLATANLIDSSTLNDGWKAENRGLESTGAGITATQTAFWNVSGSGLVQSMQYGWGYVIGTQGVGVNTSLSLGNAAGTAPQDLVEGQNQGATLEPQSLYLDQRARRLGF
ncbi:MAG: glycosyl hydrolase family 28-related protein [bacterium]